VVILRFDSDIPRADVSVVTVSARWSDPRSETIISQPYSFNETLDDGGRRGFPGVVVLTPDDAVTGRTLRVEATLTLNAGSRLYVTTRADVRVVREGTVEASLFFADLCGRSGTSATCAMDDSQTCRVDAGAAVCATVSVFGADAGAAR
jgi:hypothetical protein